MHRDKWGNSIKCEEPGNLYKLVSESLLLFKGNTNSENNSPPKLAFVRIRTE
jgi:hypothetical protein